MYYVTNLYNARLVHIPIYLILMLVLVLNLNMYDLIVAD